MALTNAWRYNVGTRDHEDPTVGQSPAFRSRFATLGNLIQWFSASLPPPSSIIIAPGIIQPSNARQVLLTINLTALAQITLHRTFAPTHAPSNKRCIEGALHAVRALDGVSDPGPVSPICVVLIPSSSSGNACPDDRVIDDLDRLVPRTPR
jgi:hypothetical protein